MKKPFFSIGIIFKNEIRCLERCLKSLRPLQEAVPCEIVMADTGSTDGSREVAEKYADILFDFPWIDDFAAARNAVIDRCSGVWYMSIDADEWFNGEVWELEAFSRMEEVPQDIVGFTIRNCKSEYGEASDNYMDFTALRMMRIASGLRYEGCIHERFNRKNPTVVTLPNTLFYHDGYFYGTRAVMEEKRQRNMKLLEKKLQGDPENLQTLTEYIDSMKAAGADVMPAETVMNCVRRSLEILHGDWERWGAYGSTVYRNAVSIAKLHDQPELMEWAEKAVELYPDSLYTRIDVAYYAFSRSWDEKKTAEAVRWGEMYLAAMEDFRAGRFRAEEMIRGVIEYASPLWEQQLQIVLAQVRLELGEPEKSREILAKLDGSMMEGVAQVEGCVNILMRLHRETELDIGTVAARLWEQVNRPTPSEELAKKRREAYLKTATASFEPSYLADELERKGFRRHSYTLFLALEEDCQLRAFAAMMEETDPAVLTEKMTAWNGAALPLGILFHALETGVPFPLPGKPQTIENMGVLVRNLARQPERLCKLALRGMSMASASQICWAAELTLSAVRNCKWENEPEGLALARRFAATENKHLSAHYAPETLCDENICLLPSMHRFGWYCVQAFHALDGGDAHGYVRALRQGLENCPDMKAMVGFLTEHTPELQVPPVAPELLQLAEQVRMLLAQYPENDPAVEALKQSAAYQKVAHLIEGPEPGVFGGGAQ